MKIITIATDRVDYTLLKSSHGSETFLLSAKGAKLLTEYLEACRTVDAEETFLFICNEFDTATFKLLKKILDMLGLTNDALILFGVNHFETALIQRLQKIHRLQNRNALEFFRNAYGKFQR